jgi:hypothetical protein
MWAGWLALTQVTGEHRTGVNCNVVERVYTPLGTACRASTREEHGGKHFYLLSGSCASMLAAAGGHILCQSATIAELAVVSRVCAALKPSRSSARPPALQNASPREDTHLYFGEPGIPD